MQTSELVQAIDEEIARLEQARALLTGGEAKSVYRVPPAGALSGPAVGKPAPRKRRICAIAQRLWELRLESPSRPFLINWDMPAFHSRWSAIPMCCLRSRTKRLRRWKRCSLGEMGGDAGGPVSSV